MKYTTSDTELLEMYRQCACNLNEKKMLRVATLMKKYEDKKEVYRTIMKYFPQSQTAANELAMLYQSEGNIEKACEVLARLTQYSARVMNALADKYVYAHQYERAIELLQDIEPPEVYYNLGLIKGKKRHLQEAYELLLPYVDLNSAIVALAVNKSDEAKMILDELEDKSPVAEYVRSLTFARLGDKTNFYEHIENACSDAKLRKRAMTEPDFYRYYDEEPFQKIINKRLWK